MNKQNLNEIELEAEKNYLKKTLKKRKKMKVSGASVKKLQKIIINKH